MMLGPFAGVYCLGKSPSLVFIIAVLLYMRTLE